VHRPLSPGNTFAREEILMKQKLALFFAVALLFTVAFSARSSQPQQSPTYQQKLDALNDAYRNGLLSQEEYAAKLRQLNGGSSSPSYSAPPSASGASVAMRTATIFDPVFNHDFIHIPMPADWIFQGGIVPGNGCKWFSSPVYRISSPDGLSGLKVFPRIDLGWSNNPNLRPNGSGGCQPFDGDPKASDVMQWLVAVLQVQYERDVTDPADVESLRSRWARNTGGSAFSNNFADQAVARASFHINSIPEEEQLAVTVRCTLANIIVLQNTFKNTCTVNISFAWAPQGKLESTLALIRPSLVDQYDPEWNRLWQQALERANEAFRQRDEAYWAGVARANNLFYSNLRNSLNANHEQFMQQMNGQFVQSQAEIAQMRRIGDANMVNTMRNLDSQHRMNQDFCDSILGLQRRVNPQTGETYKTDNLTYDWVNSSGGHILTDYINDNPNGVNGGRSDYVLTQNIHN
jgi:hypothetical protein